MRRMRPRAAHVLLLGMAMALVAASVHRAAAAEAAGVPEPSGPGAALYAEHCARCHDHPVDRIPDRTFLTVVKTPEQVVRALTTGVMQAQAAGLTGDEIKSLAAFITGKRPGSDIQPDPDANRCVAAKQVFKPGPNDWNGWGHDAGNTRYQAHPGLSAADIPRLKVKWVFAYPGNVADGQPVVVGGRVFVANRAGRVFSLDARTGCTWWSFEAEGGVHAAVSVGPLSSTAPSRLAAYVTTENGYVHALDAANGNVIWATRVEDHPATRLTGSPTLYEGRLYVPLSSLEEVSLFNPDYACCTFRGGVVALDAENGKIVWIAHTIETPAKEIGRNPKGVALLGPAGAAVFAAPTVDPKRRLIYVGTGNSYTQASTDAANAIMAFDMDTGARRWSTQVLPEDDICPNAAARESCGHVGPDFDFASPPVLRRLPNGNEVLIAVSKAQEAYAFDPDRDGKLIWRLKLGQGSRHAGAWGLAVDDRRFYVGSADVRPEPGVEVGELNAVDFTTGTVQWHASAPPASCSWGDATSALARANGSIGCSPARPGAVALIPGALFSGSIDGHMRALSSRDGTLLWAFDAGRAFPAVNGATATGGSISNGAEAVADGMLFVNAGSGGLHQPGNALFAFSVDGK